MEEIMLKIDNVSKQYKLGQIGGTTLREELQRKRAKRRGEEDPTSKIGAREYVEGETFMALNGVSFEVKKGERVGIIGHNGAGKSTLLKLISRVTAPTEGKISMNGRVASMLEVGTGFHGELTGRENIYMNGAILGMTKKEIDSKIEDIIEFSECRQFIDTPVKRYSSGMYVKLAFSVAAHLDSEIMIMDEVLAVGDMAFQKKCLDKMNDVSRNEGRTILYVSHNMNTIRQLCERVVVLEHGKVVFDGDVEKAIEVYLGDTQSVVSHISYNDFPGCIFESNANMVDVSVGFCEKENNIFEPHSRMNLRFLWKNNCDIENLCLRIEIRKQDRTIIGTSILDDIYSGKQGEVATITVSMGLEMLVSSNYSATYTFYLRDQVGVNMNVFCAKGLDFKINGNDENLRWDVLHWGNVIFSDVYKMDESWRVG